MLDAHPMFHFASAAPADRARDRVRELPDARPAPRPRLGRHRLPVEALVAGTIGATVAVLWLFVTDLLRDAPLDTPATLGAHVTHALGSSGWRGAARLAATFTGLQYALFVLAGVIAVALVHRTRSGAGLRLALAATAGVLVMPLAALLAITGTAAVDAAVWLQIAAGHLAAVGTMGWYLRATHPHLRAERPPAHRVRVPRQGWGSAPGSPVGPDASPEPSVGVSSGRPNGPASEASPPGHGAVRAPAGAARGAR